MSSSTGKSAVTGISCPVLPTSALLSAAPPVMATLASIGFRLAKRRRAPCHEPVNRLDARWKGNMPVGC